jgi:hypothetical protein
MSEDVKLDLDGDKKKQPAPAMVWMRYSKVLNKWVPCLESDHEAVTYMKVRG